MTTALLWFRQDLRLADNPALNAAVAAGLNILPVYILDDTNPGPWKMGGASRVWLHHSLASLNTSLNGNLTIFNGDARSTIKEIIADTGAKAVFWNRCYEPWRVARDKEIKKDLESAGVDVKSFNASLLYEPWDVLKDDGTPYRVFTPYFRRGCVARGEPSLPMPAPKNITYAPKHKNTLPLAALNLIPKIGWDGQMTRHWDIGEAGGQARLNAFIKTGLRGYKDGRNRPDIENVSRLSPYLHFGEVSPRAAWHAARRAMAADGLERDGDHFLSELGWREFSYSLLYHTPDMPEEPLQKKFLNFPWREDDAALHCWQNGETGYPIIDAGMRELWQTGYMHNRVRMIVASFLIKDLLLHWQHGEKWFWDTLFDADLANNAASWQWVAGCGADAAPYFRIFNPVGQGEKFDPHGHYVRRYVPELAKLPNEFLHRPWEAPPLTLRESNVVLGKTYPLPIVDHAKARIAALAALSKMKDV